MMSREVITFDKLFPPSFYSLHNDVVRRRWREYWLHGGRGSGKSTFIANEILLGMMDDARKYFAGEISKDELSHAIGYRKVGSECRDSVYAQFQKNIARLNLNGVFRSVDSQLRIYFLPTMQMIRCRGCDEADKQKSVTTKFGYFKYLWFEELTQYNGMEEIRSVKQSVLRGGSEHVTFYSYNPSMMASNWVNQEALIPKEGRINHGSSYLGMPPEWLGDEFLFEAEELKKHNELAYRHEYLGEVTGTGGNVFGNVVVRKITAEERARFDNFHYGLDWGYTNAFVWVETHHDVKRKRLYITDEIYATHLTTPQAAEKVKEKDMHFLPVYADSEDANAIAQFNNEYGILTLPVVKGPDSRRFGFRWLQDLHEIVIDPETCPNAAREFTAYEFEKDKFGNLIEEYPKENDHVLDAVRYANENEAIKRGMF